MRKIIIPVLAAAVIWQAGCDDDSCRPRCCPQPPISVIRMTCLEAYNYANLMPIVPPDPIFCRLTVRIENTSSKYSYAGLSIDSALVYLASSGRYLGRFRFSADWKGALEPGETDTVTALKIQEEEQIFSPPCGEAVYMEVILGSEFHGELVERTDAHFFCVY